MMKGYVNIVFLSTSEPLMLTSFLEQKRCSHVSVKVLSLLFLNKVIPEKELAQDLVGPYRSFSLMRVEVTCGV